MGTFKDFESELYHITSQSFNEAALALFYEQAKDNPVYRNYIGHLGVNPATVRSVERIPFLPVSFFKNHPVKTGTWETEALFTSSGTTGMVTSRNEIPDLSFYLRHAERTFESFFGSLQGYHLLALLPSYLERQNSSLVAMIDHFIACTRSPYSGFYLHNTDQLLQDLEALRLDGKKVILWGVTFALLDLAEKHPDLSHCVIFETGGMKGRRKEITRHELHQILTESLHVSAIYSEYGMTELLSQAYTKGRSLFYSPPWMKIVGRDVTDPLTTGLINQVSGINVIDLANRHSVAFIETEDLGKIYADGSFEVLGRFDNSDLRGCNLLSE